MNFLEAFNKLTESYDDAIEPGSGFLWFLETASSSNILGLLSGLQSDNPDFEAHLFITSDGTIINVDNYNTQMLKYFSDSAMENDYTHNMHSDFIKLLWCLYLEQDNKSVEEIQETIADEDLDDILDAAFVYLVANHGWVRYTYDKEDRDDPFIQCSSTKKLSAAQQDIIEQLLVEAELKKLQFYVEFLSEYGIPITNKAYKLGGRDNPLFAEDVLERIINFYNTGRLDEELLHEAGEPAYDYTFFFAGSPLDEERFKQKLVIIIKSLKSISAMAAIPEAAEVIVSGLKEGAEIKGVSVFELGDKAFMVKAKKSAGPKATEPEDTDTGAEGINL